MTRNTALPLTMTFAISMTAMVTPPVTAQLHLAALPAEYSAPYGQRRAGVSADGRSVMLTLNQRGSGEGRYCAVLCDFDVNGIPAFTRLVPPGSNGPVMMAYTPLSADGNRVLISTRDGENVRGYVWDRYHGYTLVAGGGGAGVSSAWMSALSRNGRWAAGNIFGSDDPWCTSPAFVQRLPAPGSAEPPGDLDFNWRESMSGLTLMYLKWIGDQGAVGGDLATSEWVLGTGYASPLIGGWSLAFRPNRWPSSFSAEGVCAGEATDPDSTQRWAFVGTAADERAVSPINSPRFQQSAIAVSVHGETVGFSVDQEFWAPTYFWYQSEATGMVPLERLIDPLPDGLRVDGVLNLTDDGTKVVGWSQSPWQADTGVVWVATIHPTGCGSADFNGDRDVGTDQDIEAFFACMSGDCCLACVSADIDVDGVAGSDADIEAFFRALSGAGC